MRNALGLAAASLAVSVALAQTPLAIQNASLQTQEDGAAVDPGRLFRAGELVYGSFSVANFTKKPVGDPDAQETEISLSYEVDIVDPSGMSIQPPETGKVQSHVRREDKDWRPKVRFQFVMPPLPPSGPYHVDIWVKDELASAATPVEGKYRILFEVKGYDVAPSDKLTISNFRFQRSDHASEGALPKPTYHVGDFVWVLFDASGFKLGPKNKYDVSYGLAVLDATGKVLFEEETAAELTEEPSYPKRGLPGALSIRIADGTPKTNFQLRVRVKDRIGDQTVDQTGTFTVE